MGNKINQAIKLGLFIFFFAALNSCKQSIKSSTIDTLIPKPQEATSTGKDFPLKETKEFILNRVQMKN